MLKTMMVILGILTIVNLPVMVLNWNLSEESGLKRLRTVEPIRVADVSYTGYTVD
jgi:hypothetical protein